MTKAVPLTPEEERCLVEWRQRHEERLRDEGRKTDFYQFVKDIVRDLKRPSQDSECRILEGMTREEVNVLVFHHKNFQAMMAYKDFRRYVFSHPDYKSLCVDLNKTHLEHLINNFLDSSKKPINGKSPESLKANKQSPWTMQTIDRLKLFQVRHSLSDPQFIPRLEKACFEPGYQAYFTTSKESDEMKKMLGKFNSAKEKFLVNRDGKKDVKRIGRDRIKEQNKKQPGCLLGGWTLAQFLSNEQAPDDDPLNFWNNANLTRLKYMFECGMILSGADKETQLKLNCDRGINRGPLTPENAAAAEID